MSCTDFMLLTVNNCEVCVASFFCSCVVGLFFCCGFVDYLGYCACTGLNAVADTLTLNVTQHDTTNDCPDSQYGFTVLMLDSHLWVVFFCVVFILDLYPFPEVFWLWFVSSRYRMQHRLKWLTRTSSIDWPLTLTTTPSSLLFDCHSHPAV